MSDSRSPIESASSSPWISNPLRPKLDHLPSSLLNPSSHSHDPHLAGNPGFPSRQFEFRPNSTSPWNSIVRPPCFDSLQPEVSHHLLHLPQPLAKLLLGPIDGNRSSSGRSPLEPLDAWAAIDLLPPVVSPRPGPQESIPGEPSTSPTLFPMISSSKHCHTPPARPSPDHLA